MKQKSGPDKAPAEQVLKDIRRQTRRQYSAEEKIRIVLEGIAASMHYGCSKEFLEAGKRRRRHRPCRDLRRGEGSRREAIALKEVVADLTWRTCV
jgi:hypothetical protein